MKSWSTFQQVAKVELSLPHNNREPQKGVKIIQPIFNPMKRKKMEPQPIHACGATCPIVRACDQLQLLLRPATVRPAHRSQSVGVGAVHSVYSVLVVDLVKY